MVNKFKRLAIITDCVHMHGIDGTVVTENHVFCRQMQELAKYFVETIVCCPFAVTAESRSVSAYSLGSMHFIPLPNVGGQGIREKIKVIITIPRWISAFHKAGAAADIVYIRMPNNLSIPGFFYFFFSGIKKFATYTGTWKKYEHEPVTYRFQKWVLKHLFKGPVWVYANNEQLSRHFFSNYSPSYSLAEWNEESGQVYDRIRRYQRNFPIKPVFITVGSLVPYKNQQYILEVCCQLKKRGFSFYWYIVGDGPLMESYQRFVRSNELSEYVCITGQKSQAELRALYRKSDFLVQPSKVEGYGKAPIEALFHGVIPVLSKVPMAEEMTGHGRRGYLFSTTDLNDLECLIYKIVTEKEALASLIENGRKYAKEHTIEGWARFYIDTLNNFY